MKCSVDTNVNTVKFQFCANDCEWYTYVNDECIKIGVFPYVMPVVYPDLAKAVEQAIFRGLIPEDFDIKQLHEGTVTTIT